MDSLYVCISVIKQESSVFTVVTELIVEVLLILFSSFVMPCNGLTIATSEVEYMATSLLSQ